jgi:hypothetical protein
MYTPVSSQNVSCDSWPCLYAWKCLRSTKT